MRVVLVGGPLDGDVMDVMGREVLIPWSYEEATRIGRYTYNGHISAGLYEMDWKGWT
jgi:hypothetical protein